MLFYGDFITPISEIMCLTSQYHSSADVGMNMSDIQISDMIIFTTNSF